MRLIRLADLGRRIIERDAPSLVAIDDPSGSGKSTLARRLVEAITGATLVAIDLHYQVREHADLRVDGDPAQPHDPSTELVTF